MCIRWLVERRSPFDFAQGRLSTSLRFGRDDNSYFAGVQVPKKNRHGADGKAKLNKSLPDAMATYWLPPTA